MQILNKNISGETNLENSRQLIENEAAMLREKEAEEEQKASAARTKGNCSIGQHNYL